MPHKYKLTEMSKTASAEDAEKQLGKSKSSFEVGQVTISDDGTSKSTITNIHPQTGAVQWKVENLPGFDMLYDELDDLVDVAKRVYIKTKEDKKFRDFYDQVRKLRNSVRTHLRNEYPDQYKRIVSLGEAIKIPDPTSFADMDDEEKEQMKVITGPLKDLIKKFKLKKEVSMSGAAGSYLTPYAFSRKSAKKADDEDNKEIGYTLVEDKQDAIQELKYILTQLEDKAEEAREIIRANFPNELSRADAYGVFDVVYSGNRYDITLGRIVDELEEDGDYEIDENEKLPISRKKLAKSPKASKLASKQKMKLPSGLVNYMDYSVNEGHGLDQSDLDFLKDFISKMGYDKEPVDAKDFTKLKKILKFIIKSNILQDKTKDLSKGKVNENIGAIAGGIAAARKKKREDEEFRQIFDLAKEMGVDVTKYEKYLNENIDLERLGVGYATPKFKRGDEVDYLGRKAKIRSAKFNIYDKSFDYTVDYRDDNNQRTSADGVKDNDLKRPVRENIGNKINIARAKSHFKQGEKIAAINKKTKKLTKITGANQFGSLDPKEYDFAYLNEGTFNTDNHVATFGGDDGYAEVYKQADGSFYIVVGGDIDYDMTATDAKDVAAKLKRDGYTRLQAGELKEWDIYNKMDWEDDKDEKEARVKNTDRKKIYKDIDEEKDPDSEAERKRDKKHDKLMKKIRRGDALGLGPKRLGENEDRDLLETSWNYKGELGDIEKRISNLYREMENDPEVEPEGGPVADQYGDELNKLERRQYALNRWLKWYDTDGGVDNPAPSMMVTFQEGTCGFNIDAKTGKKLNTPGGLKSKLKYKLKESAARSAAPGTKNPGATLGPGPAAGPDGVTDNAYIKQFKFQLVPKNKDGTYVQKGSGMIVKKLF